MLKGLDLEDAVSIVRRECGYYTHYSIDDLCSRLCVECWLEDREYNGPKHFAASVRRAIYWQLRNSQFRLKRQRNFSEILGEAITDKESDWLDKLITPSEPQQHTQIEAKRIRKMALGFPYVHRRLVLILAEGATIVDAARELGLDGYSALRLLHEIGEYICTGHSTPHLQKFKRAA